MWKTANAVVHSWLVEDRMMPDPMPEPAPRPYGALNDSQESTQVSIAPDARSSPPPAPYSLQNHFHPEIADTSLSNLPSPIKGGEHTAHNNRQPLLGFPTNGPRDGDSLTTSLVSSPSTSGSDKSAPYAGSRESSPYGAGHVSLLTDPGDNHKRPDAAIEAERDHWIQQNAIPPVAVPHQQPLNPIVGGGPTTTSNSGTRPMPSTGAKRPTFIELSPLHPSNIGATNRAVPISSNPSSVASSSHASPVRLTIGAARGAGVVAARGGRGVGVVATRGRGVAATVGSARGGTVGGYRQPSQPVTAKPQPKLSRSIVAPVAPVQSTTPETKPTHDILIVPALTSSAVDRVLDEDPYSANTNPTSTPPSAVQTDSSAAPATAPISFSAPSNTQQAHHLHDTDANPFYGPTVELLNNNSFTHVSTSSTPANEFPPTVVAPTHHQPPSARPTVRSSASVNVSAIENTSMLTHSQNAALRLKRMYPVTETRQVNCLILGRAGNGKSSLINSIYQTLTDSTSTLCEEGSADRSCTLRYACCGALCTEQALPLVLFDTKGLLDSRDGSTRNLVQLLLRGKFRPDHSMNNPKWSDCYLFPDRALKIDVVIFVYAYGAVFPHRLAESIADEAAERNVSVMPVITFYDKVQHDDQLNVHLDCCARIFNTRPIFLTNLGAIRAFPQSVIPPPPDTPTSTSLSSSMISTRSTVRMNPPMTPEEHMERSKKAVLDLVSQAMIFGQQHHRHKKYDVSVPLSVRTGNNGGDCIIS